MYRRDIFEQFTTDVYHVVNGEYVRWSNFTADFAAYLAARGIDPMDWPEDKIRQRLGHAHPVGRGPSNHKIIGNLSKEHRLPKRWVAVGNNEVRLVRALELASR